MFVRIAQNISDSTSDHYKVTVALGLFDLIGEMASKTPNDKQKPYLPSVETIQQERGSAESLDDFFGREGIFARLFSKTLEELLEAELTAHLGYEKYAAEGRNSGNSRNGKRDKKRRTQTGDVQVQVPHDRKGEYHPLRWR